MQDKQRKEEDKQKKDAKENLKFLIIISSLRADERHLGGIEHKKILMDLLRLHPLRCSLYDAI